MPTSLSKIIEGESRMEVVWSHAMSLISETAVRLDDTPPEPGQAAIWKAKDSDYSVTIVGDLGMGMDGRRYVSVESTNAGIPLDELELCIDMTF